MALCAAAYVPGLTDQEFFWPNMFRCRGSVLIELVGEAERGGMSSKRKVIGHNKRKGCGRYTASVRARVGVGDGAEIRITIFGARDPVGPQRSLEAATDCQGEFVGGVCDGGRTKGPPAHKETRVEVVRLQLCSLLRQ